MVAGASADQYYLAAQDTAGVQPPGKLNVTNITAASSRGQLQTTFTLTLTEAQVTAATTHPPLHSCWPGLVALWLKAHHSDAPERSYPQASSGYATSAPEADGFDWRA